MQSYEQKISDALKRFTLDEIQVENCKSLYKQYEEYLRLNQKIAWERVIALKDEAFMNYENLPEPSPAQTKDLLKKVACLKLNGGLGTSMGCLGPKSLLNVRDNRSFLDFSLKQLEYLNTTYGSNVPLVLMNSFNTDKDTLAHLEKVKPAVTVYNFNQFELPRMDAESKLPAEVSSQNQFYPPGHGYVYECLKRSGIVEKLLAQGVEWLFISNADNLGAVLDPRIAQFCVSSDKEFVSEQTLKTEMDVKGGVLMQYDGSIHLLESAQVPAEHMNDFCDTNTFKYFNVNNLWVNLKALMKHQNLVLDLIVNPKTVEGKKVIQLEVAAGAAIANFNSVGVVVPRKRFQPVKKSGDLLLLMSDCFEVTKEFLLQQVVEKLPVVTSTALVNEFLNMFQNIPSLKEAHKVEIDGQVKCGKNVKIVGNFTVQKGESVELKDGQVVGK
ncbi:UTP-glucose-1-phosphate_uridylyltransferase [Hexamita inflata]|uniref:UTP--glucose-1-phosphate uridylyltransferase n=1 Tax=Hexamita inflata TaxID=28002 RepID=A0AA86Q3A7_9EUKA|nr:UTP-glucose-1-phosphate uridylyltransferase [Hexamita inflata]